MSEVTSQLAGRPIWSGTLDLIEDQTRGQHRDRSRGPDRGQVIDAINGQAPGKSAGQDVGGQVHGVQGQAVGGLIAKAVSAVECADKIGGRAAAGDQNQSFVADRRPDGRL